MVRRTTMINAQRTAIMGVVLRCEGLIVLFLVYKWIIFGIIDDLSTNDSRHPPPTGTSSSSFQRRVCMYICSFNMPMLLVQLGLVEETGTGLGSDLQ